MNIIKDALFGIMLTILLIPCLLLMLVFMVSWVISPAILIHWCLVTFAFITSSIFGDGMPGEGMIWYVVGAPAYYGLLFLITEKLNLWEA